MISFKALVRASSSLLALLPASGWAQAGPLPAENRPESIASEAASDADEGGELIVTARRKAEALTEVPASITSLNSDFLQSQNIQRFSDYITRIPNLSFSYGGTNYGFSSTRTTTIRGVVGANTTAYYLDDTPVPSTISPQIIDLERVEVLKGPQGTLFGASSMGGNVRFITRKPSLTQNEYRVRVQGGATKYAGADYGGEVVTNLVVSEDKLAIHAVAQYDHLSGFIARTYPDPATGARVRKDDQGATDSISGSVTIRAAPTESLGAIITLIGQDQKLHGLPAAYAPSPDFQPTSYTLDRARDVPEKSQDRWGLGSLALSYAGDNYTLSSSVSYFSRRSLDQEDGTEGTDTFIRRIYGVNFNNTPQAWAAIFKNKIVTHESKISFGDDWIPGLSGIAGFFFQRDSATTTSGGPNAEPLYLPGLAASGLYPTDLNWYTLSKTRTDNSAFFGELYYEILPKLTLTAGLRKYWLKQINKPGFSTGFAYGEDYYSPETRFKQSGLVPKFVASYAIAGNGNVYVSASKGFRIGGSGNGVPDVCTPGLTPLGLTQEDTRRYTSDNLWNYEIGAKRSFVDGRLAVSAAAFQIDWSNIQQNISLDCGFGFIGNAGKARIRGTELEVSGRPIRNTPLTVQLGVGYLDARLLEPGALPQEAGSRLHLVPKWTGTASATYEFAINDSTGAFISSDYSYSGSVYSTNVSTTPRFRRSIQMFNARIGFTIDRSEFSIYGQNLFNRLNNFGDMRNISYEQAILNADDRSIGRMARVAVGRPLQIGLQYRWKY